MKNRGMLGIIGVFGICLMTTPVSMAAEGAATDTTKVEAWSFVPDPKLPNVLIIGDSISIGYTLDVRKMLAGKANVYRPLISGGSNAVNCSGTTLGARDISAWIGDTKWDVIHFNFGLHDMKHESKDPARRLGNLNDPHQANLEQYSRNMEQIVAKMEATGAKLIFATTTPVVPGVTGHARDPEDSPRYNAAAKKLMTARGIKVNDLYSFILPRLEELQLPKNVHFKPEGYQALAGEVANMIEGALPAKR